MDGRKRPPSYYKYKKNHPPIAMTLTTELKEMLDAVKGERSYGVATQEIIKKELIPALEIKKQLEAAKEAECAACKEEMQKEIQKKMASISQFIIPCPRCKGPMIVSEKNAIWRTKIYPILLAAFKGSLCDKCTKQNRQK